MGEEVLVDRARRGDSAALEELFRRSYPVLKGFLVRLTLDEDLAEEIAQETMLRALLHLGEYRPHARFSTWLAAIALNFWRNMRRRVGRIVPWDEVPEPAADDPAEAVLQKEIRSLLATLPPEKRIVFVLKHYEGLTYEEIAVMLRCPVGTVRSRLHDGIAILRREARRRGLL